MARIHWQDGRDLLTRTVAPGVVLWCAIVGLGLLLAGPLQFIDEAEDGAATAFTRNRSELWNPISDVWSRFGNTEYVIGVGVVVALVLLWRTRDWRFSAVPIIAISLQATIFVLAAWTVGRQRPPAIPMDPSPPTSSFPSGHVGASTALYLSFLLLAQRIERPWLRWLVTVVCGVIPLLVAYARLYRGAHHISDVVVGLVNGIVCAGLAYAWYRRRNRAATQADRHEVGSTRHT